MAHKDIGTELTKTEFEATDAHLPETLPELLESGTLLHIPTTGWTESNTGSGVVTQKVSKLRVDTFPTGNSRGMAYAALSGFDAGITNTEAINWDKKLYFIYRISRGLGGDGNTIARLQIKDVITEGALADKGIGIRFDNLTLVGESYGSALGDPSLGTTVTTGLSYQLVIIHYPASKIEWYVNGVLKATQTDTTKIPSGMSLANCHLLHSIINQATAVRVFSEVYHPKIWQEL